VDKKRGRSAASTPRAADLPKRVDGRNPNHTRPGPLPPGPPLTYPPSMTTPPPPALAPLFNLPAADRRAEAARWAAHRRTELALYHTLFAERYGLALNPAAAARLVEEDPLLVELETLAAA